MRTNGNPTLAVLAGHRVSRDCPTCGGRLLWSLPREWSLLRRGYEASCLQCGRERQLRSFPVADPDAAAAAREHLALEAKRLQDEVTGEGRYVGLTAGLGCRRPGIWTLGAHH